MARSVDNRQDVLDSRDVIARIRELESELEDARDTHDLEDCEDSETPPHNHEACACTCHEVDQDLTEELAALKALEEEASESPDWAYGETLIRDTYFEEYAEECAYDWGACSREYKHKWPLNHIDWEAAADELKADYMRVDFDGEDYWIRA
jgi:hypothetical protein